MGFDLGENDVEGAVMGEEREGWCVLGTEQQARTGFGEDMTWSAPGVSLRKGTGMGWSKGGGRSGSRNGGSRGGRQAPVNAQGNEEVGRGRGGMHQPSFNQNVITVLYTEYWLHRLWVTTTIQPHKRFWNHPCELLYEGLSSEEMAVPMIVF